MKTSWGHHEGYLGAAFKKPWGSRDGPREGGDAVLGCHASIPAGPGKGRGESGSNTGGESGGLGGLGDGRSWGTLVRILGWGSRECFERI